MEFEKTGGLAPDFFRHVVLESADSVLAVDMQQRIVLFNPAAEALFGYRREDVLGERLELLLPERFRDGHAQKVSDFHAKGEKARHMGKRSSPIVGRRADGSDVMLWASILTVGGEGGPHMVAIVRDITERVMLHQELERMASADPLTGALNRRAFLAELDREWNRATRYRSGLSLMLFDLDEFKSVNDTYGHDVGDQVICRFADQAMLMLRDIDIFGRWGGEEFIAVLPHSDLRSARCVGERLRESFGRQRFAVDGHDPFSVTVSVGVAEIGAGKASQAQLIKWADEALYEAKQNGRDQVVVRNAKGGIRVLGDGTSG